MDFGHASSNETDNGGLLDSLGPRIHEVVEAAREQPWQPMPPVVSAGAHHQHAIATLEEKAADKAVEPLDERIREPLTVAFQQTAAEQTTSLVEPQLQTLASWKPARIAVKAKGKILLIDPADVVAFEAKGNYVLLQHRSRSDMLRGSISTMEEKLSPHGFVRIHRSVLVNAALVEEIRPRPAGESVLRVRGGREYTVTRTYKK